MIWILIIMTIGGPTVTRPNHAVGIEFNTWPACVEASRRIEKIQRTVTAICVKKGAR